MVNIASAGTANSNVALTGKWMFLVPEVKSVYLTPTVAIAFQATMDFIVMKVRTYSFPNVYTSNDATIFLRLANINVIDMTQ